MNRFLLAFLALGAALCAVPASAQMMTTRVVSSCGTPGTALPTGGSWFMTVDTNGNVCMNGSGGSIVGSSSNASDGVATSSTNIPGIRYQYIFNGTTWDRARGDTTNGQWVNVKALPATPAGTNAIGYFGGFNIVVPNAPTVQNAAYSASNAIGGLQTVAAFRNTTQPSGILNYVQAISHGGSTQGMTIYGWSKTPTATCTDKAAFVPQQADEPYALPGFPVVLTPAVTQGTTVSRASQSIVTSVNNQDTTAAVNLYFCAVVNGSVTPASTTDLTFQYALVRD
jgi:hypothetical protein